MANLNKFSERYKQKLFLLIVLFNFQVPIDSLPAEIKFIHACLDTESLEPQFVGCIIYA